MSAENPFSNNGQEIQDDGVEISEDIDRPMTTKEKKDKLEMQKDALTKMKKHGVGDKKLIEDTEKSIKSLEEELEK